MRRLFWLALGATLGVLIFRKLSRTARSLTPRSLAGALAHNVSGLGESVQDFVADLRVAMHEREEELLAALSDDGTGPAAPSGGQRR